MARRPAKKNAAAKQKTRAQKDKKGGSSTKEASVNEGEPLAKEDVLLHLCQVFEVVSTETLIPILRDFESVVLERVQKEFMRAIGQPYEKTITIPSCSLSTKGSLSSGTASKEDVVTHLGQVMNFVPVAMLLPVLKEFQVAVLDRVQQTLLTAKKELAEIRYKLAPTLSTLPEEIHQRIFGKLDRVSSTCLAVTCKKLWPIHKKFRGKVPLLAWHSIDASTGEGKRLWQLFDSWMMPQYFWCTERRMFVTNRPLPWWEANPNYGTSHLRLLKLAWYSKCCKEDVKDMLELGYKIKKRLGDKDNVWVRIEAEA